jgi:hypothetical protein
VGDFFLLAYPHIPLTVFTFVYLSPGAQLLSSLGRKLLTGV